MADFPAGTKWHPRDAELRQRLTDTEALAITLVGEAAVLPMDGRLAVACVVRNRAALHWYGGTIRSNCLWRWQFSCWEPTGGPDDPLDADVMGENYERVMAWAVALVDRSPWPASGASQRVFRACWALAERVVRGEVTDITLGATHYYNPAGMVPPGRVPKWAEGHQPVVVVGPHRFFRLASGS